MTENTEEPLDQGKLTSATNSSPSTTGSEAGDVVVEDAATTDKSKEGGPLGDMVPANHVETYEVYWRDGRHAILMGQTYLFKEENGVTDQIGRAHV